MSTEASVGSGTEGLWVQPVRWEYRTVVKRMGAVGWVTPERDRAALDGSITLRPLGDNSLGSELSRLLNRLGSEGWELVSQIADELVLKRPVL